MPPQLFSRTPPPYTFLCSCKRLSWERFSVTTCTSRLGLKQLGEGFGQKFAAHLLGGPDCQKCFRNDPLLGRPNFSVGKTCVVSAGSTSGVSAAKTSVVLADKTSAVIQDIPIPLPTRPCCSRLRNAISMSRETTDGLSADTTDVLSADTKRLLTGGNSFRPVF